MSEISMDSSVAVVEKPQIQTNKNPALRIPAPQKSIDIQGRTQQQAQDQQALQKTRDDLQDLLNKYRDEPVGKFPGKAWDPKKAYIGGEEVDPINHFTFRDKDGRVKVSANRLQPKEGQSANIVADASDFQFRRSQAEAQNHRPVDPAEEYRELLARPQEGSTDTKFPGGPLSVRTASLGGVEIDPFEINYVKDSVTGKTIVSGVRLNPRPGESTHITGDPATLRLQRPAIDATQNSEDADTVTHNETQVSPKPHDPSENTQTMKKSDVLKEPPSYTEDTDGKRMNWDIVANSVRGASHEKKNLPNQDSLKYTKLPNGDAVLAVADGHGSESYFRSQDGSKFAVETATEILKQVSDMVQNKTLKPQDLEKYLQDTVRQQIIDTWKAKVEADLLQRPITDEELTKNISDVTKRAKIKNNNIGAYGSTMLIAANIDNKQVYLQLGDGDIVVTYEDQGKTEIYRPIPDDPKLMANETTSLSGLNKDQIQVKVTSIRSEAKPKIMVCTDGIVNSYEKMEYFYQLAKDLYNLSDDEINKNLPYWLAVISQQGSGDDITLGWMSSS